MAKRSGRSKASKAGKKRKRPRAPARAPEPQAEANAAPASPSDDRPNDDPPSDDRPSDDRPRARRASGEIVTTTSLRRAGAPADDFVAASGAATGRAPADAPLKAALDPSFELSAELQQQDATIEAAFFERGLSHDVVAAEARAAEENEMLPGGRVPWQRSSLIVGALGLVVVVAAGAIHLGARVDTSDPGDQSPAEQARTEPPAPKPAEPNTVMAKDAPIEPQPAPEELCAAPGKAAAMAAMAAEPDAGAALFVDTQPDEDTPTEEASEDAPTEASTESSSEAPSEDAPDEDVPDEDRADAPTPEAPTQDAPARDASDNAPSPTTDAPSASTAPARMRPSRNALVSSCRRAYEQRQFDAAIRQCREALGGGPVSNRDADLAAFVAHAATERGRIATGREWARRALRANPGLALPHMILGLAAQQKGDEAVAKRHYVRYLQLAPSGPFAADLRAIVRTL